MLNEEKEILINLKECMQENIDKGFHKFIYNDLGWDFKCVDCINTIDDVLNLIEKQQKEIERLEKKNKRYEKIIEHKDNKCEELLEFIETEKETDYVSKDKIKAKIEEYEQNLKEFEEYWSKDTRKLKKTDSIDYYKLEALKELLEKE